MGLKDKTTSYEDYKYVLQDVGAIGLGAKFTYEELISREEVPFKVKKIFEKDIFSGMEPETTLESYLYYLNANGFAYECLKQLKAKVKFAQIVTKKGLFGKTKKEYQIMSESIEKFASRSVSDKEKAGVIVQELTLSKLAVMVFSA